MEAMRDFQPGEKARAALWTGMLAEYVMIIRRCDMPCATDGLPMYRCETPAGMVLDLCSSVLFAIRSGE